MKGERCMCGFDDCRRCHPDIAGSDCREEYEPEVDELDAEEIEDEDGDEDEEPYNPFEDLDEDGEPTPRAKSALDPGGVYNTNGDCIGRIPCGCEDYPCCGH